MMTQLYYRRGRRESAFDVDLSVTYPFRFLLFDLFLLLFLSFFLIPSKMGGKTREETHRIMILVFRDLPTVPTPASTPSCPATHRPVPSREYSSSKEPSGEERRQPER